MDIRDDENRTANEPLMTPLEELERRSGPLEEPASHRDDEGGGMPVFTRNPLPMPGSPYPTTGVPVLPEEDEEDKPAVRGFPQADYEGQRREGE